MPSGISLFTLLNKIIIAILLAHNIFSPYLSSAIKYNPNISGPVWEPMAVPT